MRVHDLIAYLQTLPQDAVVEIPVQEGCYSFPLDRDNFEVEERVVQKVLQTFVILDC